MVILISAEGSTGKTLMAQRLMEKYKIPYLSIDHLKMGLYRSNTDCGFTPESDREIIEGKLWPIIREMIKTAIENNQHMIIEGCYLFPERLKEFDEEYLCFIIPVFMGFTANYVKNNFHTGIIAHRSDIEQRGYDEDRSIEQIIAGNAALQEKCRAESIDFFEIDGDYETDTARVYDWIDQKVRTMETIQEKKC